MSIFILVFIAIAALAVIIHSFAIDAANNHDDDTRWDETGDDPFPLDDSLLNDPINAWNPANIYHDSFSDSPMHNDDDMFSDTDSAYTSSYLSDDISDFEHDIFDDITHDLDSTFDHFND